MSWMMDSKVPSSSLTLARQEARGLLLKIGILDQFYP